MRSINEGEAAKPELLASMARAYEGSVAYSDRELGAFLARLGSVIDLAGSELVFTSDHGEGFFEHRFVGHRNWLYEELTRIPLILRGPQVPAGQRSSSPASLVDLVPTLLGLTGARPGPAPLSQGIDLLDPAAGSRLLSRGAESEFLNGAAIVDGDWKLTFHGDYPSPLQFALYDLRSDPDEGLDLLAQQPDVARRLHAALRDWRARTRQLAVSPAPIDLARLTPELMQNLRALGYAR
jgi:arylsulfatase A-like enzyme